MVTSAPRLPATIRRFSARSTEKIFLTPARLSRLTQSSPMGPAP